MYWDGSQHSKLLLRASLAALPIYVNKNLSPPFFQVKDKIFRGTLLWGLTFIASVTSRSLGNEASYVVGSWTAGLWSTGKNSSIWAECCVLGTEFTYLLSYSMVQSPSWEANWFAASQEIPHIFMEPEGSLPHSQASATCPYPGSAKSSPHTHIPPPGDPS